jgi:excinuclease UvrABC nuclease subunit
LLGDIGKCAAPCVDWISKEDHKKLAERLNEFMESGMENILPKLHEEMNTAAANEEFERAARLRDQIESFEKAQKSLKETSPMILMEISSLFTTMVFMQPALSFQCNAVR